MSLLHENGWVDELNIFMNNPKNKLLGICLGMQLMFNSSEEGVLPGLGWIDGKVKKFAFKEKNFRIPHMGWNIINTKSGRSLFEKKDDLEKRYYFVHSYHVVCNNQSDIAATCDYGYNFTCAIEKGNLLGVQFHPEKSHRFGMELMKIFIGL
jgi:glutamine amidotransferase